MMKDWTTDELVVAAITLQHDLRGSWNGDYSGRIHELQFICEAILDNEAEAEDQTKKEFIERLSGAPNLVASALQDIQVCKDELNNIAEGYADGRIFRDGAVFYDMTMPEAGQTIRVIEFLEITVDCDDFLWFQRD